MRVQCNYCGRVVRGFETSSGLKKSFYRPHNHKTKDPGVINAVGVNKPCPGRFWEAHFIEETENGEVHS